MQVTPPVSKTKWIKLNEGRAADSQFVTRLQATINKWAESFAFDEEEMSSALRAVMRSATSSRRHDYQSPQEHHAYLRMVRCSTEMLLHSQSPHSQVPKKVQRERDALEEAALLLYHVCINEQFGLELGFGLEQCRQGGPLPFCVADYLELN